MVGGLFRGVDALSRDFKTHVWRIKALGFNTIRLPFDRYFLKEVSMPCPVLC